MNKAEWVFYYCKDRDGKKNVVDTGTFARPEQTKIYKELRKLMALGRAVTIGYIRKEKFDIENELYSRPTFQDIIAKAKKIILAQYGDIGTCVLGMRLIYKSVPIAEGIVQGNTTNYHFFDEVQKQL